MTSKLQKGEFGQQGGKGYLALILISYPFQIASPKAAFP